jgi:RNA polymerase sigma-70 factor (ECF subfamily)
MSEGPTFRELMQGVRTGDEAAAAELVRRYEAGLRRAVRARLRDARLRRLFDSADVCQSVFASFFVRAALGQYELEHPEQLARLLEAMARNKVANRAEHEQAARRDYRRVEAGEGWEDRAAAPGPTASWVAASRELLDHAHRRLSPEERRLLELREQGRGWPEIAAELGGSPEALRKRLERAVERVTTELGLGGATAE